MNLETAIQNAKKPRVRPFEAWCAKEYLGFQGNPKGKIYLGVEMEFELTGDLPEEVIDEGYGALSDYYSPHSRNKDALTKRIDKVNDLVGDFAIIKDDASLSHGLEIASAPSSYRKHFGQWNKFFKNLAANHLASQASCGMHVHVSKKRLSERQKANLPAFFTKANQPFMERIAGRKQNKYCIYALTGRTKREALNRTPKVTWEFRLFKTPTNREEFLIRLQFVQAILDFCDLKKYVNTAEAFKNWLQKQRQYKELRNYIETQGL